MASQVLLNDRLGEFTLLKRLAVGGQSEVYLALKQGPDDYTRPVVIKALPDKSKTDKKLLAMFYREAFISSRFIHPNVINVHNATVIDGEHCMMMDFISGQTVADIAQRGFKKQCPPTLKQVAQIIIDACEGLHYVHDFRDLNNKSYSVVHSDVSPQNLMVTYSGVTMVFDFGIAQITGYKDEIPNLVGGKYAYMSPEQLLGQEVGPRSDIFSLGVILYELTTGYRLFRRDSPQEVIKAVTEDPITPPIELRPEIPQFLDQIIMKALDRDPITRYRTTKSMRDDLQQFLGMTGDGTDLRRGLGAYVAGMFKERREEIAELLASVDDVPNPIEGTSIPTLSPEPSLELDALHVRTARQNNLATMTVETAQTAAMLSEIDKLEKRQTWLLGMIIVSLAVIVSMTLLAVR